MKMKKNLQTKFSTRQYMLSKDFEIYYYKDLPKSKLEDHSHNYYEFYFFLEGYVSIEIAGERRPLQYGDVVLFSPEVAHHAIMIEFRLTQYRQRCFA